MMYSDFDLLCVEDAGLILADECTFSEYSLDLDLSPVDMEESIAGFIEDEGDFVPGFDYPARFSSSSLDASARQDSIAWILKVHAIFKFQAVTAYLAINYLDRFLACRLLPQPNGWPLQLLSVACLSLAAKMEESLVPSLLDIQVGDAKFIFEPRTIRRMELLVLSALDWRLRSVTPFNFLHFFANKVDSKGTIMGFLIAKATEIILMIMKEVNFLGHWPSVVAAAAILCAADEIPNLSPVAPGNAEAWCNGLSKDRVVSCYKLMQEVVVDNCPRTPPKTQFPQFIRSVMAGSNDSDSSSSSSSSWSPLSNKRRKLNNWLTEDDEGKL
ncbi:hypothetical protein Scep_017720 [Stephania cephalantha]|uniref:Cyclin D1 n=1 Tax=Stephania cephalantha TaxID=152367 RepID=A0AAP0IRY0_9MAGN